MVSRKHSCSLASEKLGASLACLVPGFMLLTYLWLFGLQHCGLYAIFLMDFWQQERCMGTAILLGAPCLLCLQSHFALPRTAVAGKSMCS